MHFVAHLAAAAAAGLAIYRRTPQQAALLALGGVAIDIDHFVLYAWRSGDWSLMGALHYDRYRHLLIQAGDTRPRFGSLRSVAHEPRVALPILGLLAAAWPASRPFVFGVVLHLLLDIHLPHYDWRVWERAGGCCERCNVPGLEREVYYRVSPRRGGDRFGMGNRVVWCTACARDVYREREMAELAKYAAAQKPQLHTAR